MTILLSSHLLNEVELLCSRIAVMNQGRKVFEGPLTDVKKRPGSVRLRAGDFEGAVKLLLAANLIEGSREGRFITPAAGVGTDLIISFLVGQGMPVYELAVEEQTLEGFYLSLVKQQARS